MNMTDTLKPNRTRSSDSALGARSLRLVADWLKSVLSRRMFMVYPPPPTNS